MDLKLLKPKPNFFFLRNKIFLYGMPALWSLEVNKAILEEVKVAE